MSLRIFSLKFLLFSLILILIIGIVASEPLYCTKVDFNRPTFSEFIKCKNKFVPLFVIENYVNNSSIQPYRPTSEYFLSANAEGFTCAESTATFFLNSSSRIDAAIFLSFKNPGAFVEILVFDADRDIPVYSWKNDSSNGWYTIWGKIGITIKNARIEIHTNMNKNSLLAIEYLNVLNTEIFNSVCLKSTEGTTTTNITAIPTTEPIPTTVTTTNSPTSSPTVSETSTVTVANDAPADENQPLLGMSNTFWKILSPILAFIILFSFCALVYAIFWYRNATDQLQLINKVDSNPKDSYNPNDAISHYSTLPRLKVIDDKDKGISIVGVEQSDITHVASKTLLSNR